jgi:hypothetical protein
MSTLPTFDPDEWAAKLPPADDGVSLIIGPADALAFQSARQRILAEHTPPISAATDVFLFGIGEGPARAGTKVGGLPYLHRHDKWPTDAHGKPLPFMAQFNFTESRDIVGDSLHGDILLLFGVMPIEDYRNMGVTLVWKSLDETGELVELHDMPIRSRFDAFFGVRWRTTSYSTYDQMEYWQEASVSDIVYSCQPFATQIGPLPFAFGRNQEPFDGGHLCCLTPICPVTDGPFPFMNHAKPIPSAGGFGQYDFSVDEETGLCFPDLWMRWGDSPTLYVYRTAAGEFAVDFISG